MDTDTITVYDNDGNAKNYDILFTYDDEDTSSSYVFYYDPEDEEQVFVSKYDDAGHLFPIEDGAEWDKAEEILASYSMKSDTETEVCDGCEG